MHFSGKAGPGKNALAYRPMYGALGELRSLAGPKIPVIALTATASNHVRNMIKNDLCMNENIFELAINPNKTNIKFWAIETKRSRGDITKDFDWLVDLIRKEGVNTPRMIIFFRKIDHIADVYEHLETSLGKRGYLNYEQNKINDDRNRLFDMFHLKTDDEVKESITNSYQDPTGHTRVVLCFTSFSMGLNVKGVDTVIHYGACNDLDDFLQETGRAGRHADDKCHSIVMKYKQCLSSKNITQNIKDFVNATTCRRKLLLEPFTDETIVEEGHNCCDICAVNCACLCLCNEGNTCDCGVKCPSNTSKVYDRITQFIENEIDIDDEDSNSEGFDTDSDIDEHINRKPCVVDYSSDYE
jgi:ATP-dependent DNA helicase RecQ